MPNCPAWIITVEDETKVIWLLSAMPAPEPEDVPWTRPLYLRALDVERRWATREVLRSQAVEVGPMVERIV